MPNRLFIKVYVGQDLHDQVHELARLLSTSAGGLVREYLLEEINIERRLIEARATEAARLALLQKAMAARAGQGDWIASAEGTAPGGAHGPAGSRHPRTSGRKRGKSRVRRSGARKRGGR
jgi:hypothetical protein